MKSKLGRTYRCEIDVDEDRSNSDAELAANPVHCSETDLQQESRFMVGIMSEQHAHSKSPPDSSNACDRQRSTRCANVSKMICFAISYTCVFTFGRYSVHPSSEAFASSGPEPHEKGFSASNGTHSSKRENSTALSSDAPASYAFVYTTEGIAIFEQLLGLANRTGGPEASLIEAQRLLVVNRHFLDACHPLLHRLGRALFKGSRSGLVASLNQLVEFDVELQREAAALTNDEVQLYGSAHDGSRSSPIAKRSVDLLMTCNAAYLHGTVEHFLHKAGLADQLSHAVRFVKSYICSRFRSGGEIRPLWECEHGVGHGILQYQRYIGTRLALDKALREAGAASTLWNGIWMDHFASTTVSGSDADDPVLVMSVCSDPELGAKHGSADCFYYAPTAFLLHRPRAYVAAFRWCDDGCAVAGSSCYGPCSEGIGSQTLKENLDNMRLVGQVCAKASSIRLQSLCISGANTYYQFATGESMPLRYCNQIEHPALKSTCILNIR
eukprot:TRINITY_DN21813_c0_g1_i1.p1 TRINITY_DN21813_c0_g1~~TRINITY_DN21813_c0_g1_i1.p1  ORF type:complete len:497 (+),score=30.36 TRINITY_DN21813_c0_g1_i1:192-1682(+)